MTQTTVAKQRSNAELMAALAKMAGVSLATAYRWQRCAVKAHPGNARRLAAAARRLGIPEAGGAEA